VVGGVRRGSENSLLDGGEEQSVGLVVVVRSKGDVSALKGKEKEGEKVLSLSAKQSIMVRRD
jgi:hypothetical protein